MRIWTDSNEGSEGSDGAPEPHSRQPDDKTPEAAPADLEGAVVRIIEAAKQVEEGKISLDDLIELVIDWSVDYSPESSVHDILLGALAQVKKTRDSGLSANETLRDLAYYLMCAAARVDRNLDFNLIFMKMTCSYGLGIGVYNYGVKLPLWVLDNASSAVGVPVSFTSIIESDKGRPVSSPGGTSAAARGFEEGGSRVRSRYFKRRLTLD